MSQGVGSDQVSPLPTFLRKKHDTRRPISFPQALLNSKLNPSGSFLRITTEQPHSTTFRAKYGLKAPGLLEDIFREKAPPTIPDQTTRSPFKSLIRVPAALNMLGDIPVNANIRRKPSKIPTRKPTRKPARKPVAPVYQLYQKDQDQIRDASYISDVVFF